MKGNKIALLVPLALVLSGCVGEGVSFASLWQAGWQSVALTAVLLSILFVSLAYMFGYAFRQPQLAAWARNELYQALASAFIVGIAVGTVYFVSNLSLYLAVYKTGGSDYGTICPGAAAPTEAPSLIEQVFGGGGTKPCDYHINKAIDILRNGQSVMITQADQLLNVMMRISFVEALGKYYDLSISPGGPFPLWPWPHPAKFAFGISFSPYPGVSMFRDAVAIFFPLLFMWIASFIAQELFLRMIRDALFPLLLTLGIILRVFFFTRKIGGLLISIALSLYTIYPLMYILLQEQFQISPNNVWYDRWNPLTCICDTSAPLGVDAMKLGYELKESIVCPIRYCSRDLLVMLFLPITLFDIGLFEFDWLFISLEKVGEMMVPALFIPIVVFLVTIAQIKGLSPLLGGDVEIAGLTHLI